MRQSARRAKRSRRAVRTLATALAAASTGCASANVVLSTWNGGANGAWSNASAWLPRIVPSNAGGTTYDVVINGSPSIASVALDMSATIDHLNVTSNDTLTVQSSRTLTIAGSGVHVDGLVKIGTSGFSVTQLLFAQDGFIDGTGEVAIGAESIYSITAAAGKRITISPGVRVTGIGGAFGNNVGNLTNLGTIESIGGTGFKLDFANGSNVNDGLIRATAGTLTITATDIDNTNGTIGAMPGALVRITGTSKIIGGDVGGLGGIFRVADGELQFVDVNLFAPAEIFGPGKAQVEGTLFLNGDLTLSPNGSTSGGSLSARPPQSIITGAGTILMLGPNYGAGLGSFAGGTFLVDRGISITGTGDIGVSTELHGYLETSHPDGIRITGLNRTLTNLGSINVTNGPLIVRNATIDNTGNTISFAAPIRLESAPSTLRGGTWASSNGSHVIVPGSSSSGGTSIGVLNDLVLFADIDVNDGVNPNTAELQLTDDVELHGQISLNAGTGPATLKIVGNEVTLHGEGKIVLTPDDDNHIIASTTGSRLIIPPEFTLQGGGRLGFGSLLFTNHSLIESAGGGSLIVYAAPGPNFNDGEMRAIDGQLWIGNTVLNNDDGLIAAYPTGTLRLTDGAVIHGGTIANYGGTVMLGFSTVPIVEDVTLIGPMTGTPGLGLSGTVINQGDITFPASSSTVYCYSPFCLLDGPGKMIFSNATAGTIGGISSVTLAILVNGSQHTIRGAVKIGADLVSFINEGAVIAEGTGITIDTSATGSFENEGLLEALTGNITINPGGFLNSGTVIIEPGRTLTRTGGYTQAAGTTIVRGQLVSTGGSTTLSGGVLRGNGSCTGASSNTGARIEPGDPFGTLSVAAFSQGAGGVLALQVGGASAGSFDRLICSGTASLNGTLEVSLANGYVPPAGTTLNILSATSVTGAFASVQSCVPLSVQYQSTKVNLVFGSASGIEGDLNGDAHVGPDDLAILLGEWGPCDAPCCLADLDGDAAVGPTDLAILMGNWSAP